jgi:polyphosphate kinase
MEERTTTREDDSLPLPELGPHNFTNRELSAIEFDKRVLAQAQDESAPLLERLRFLAIFGNNMDEFFMVRVASHLQKIQLGITSGRPDGNSSTRLIYEIRERVQKLFTEQRKTKYEILAALEKHDIYITEMRYLEPDQRAAIRAYFDSEVFPVLTPLAVDYARPFPFISNLSLNLAVFLDRDHENDETGYEFVRIKVPAVLPRLVHLSKVMRKYTGQDDPTDTFVWMEDVIADNLDLLFPGMRIIEHHPFRVVRNADIDYEHEQEDGLVDISALIEEGLRERRFGSIVRLSMPNSISDQMCERLIDELGVDVDRDAYRIEGALGSSSLFEIVALDRPELKFPLFVPRIPEPLQPGRDLFSAIRKTDILVHHPYDSFLPVEEFFRIAARDPDVLAIKTTLYRTGKNSPVVDALMEARDNDKQVMVLVELKARFDEENNLEWARALDRKGVHVTYGVEELPMKTHAKVALVVRREAAGVRRYVHLGTGNYNASTARAYTDIGLFTCHEEIADDASRLFNRLTGFAPSTSYKRLFVAPEYLSDKLIALIDNEIAAALEGKAARLIFKLNQLEDDEMIQKLYQASQAGVQVDLIVRGVCCLIPGLPGTSDNIRVISIIGRFLEHARIFYFQNAPPHQRIYTGSADLMRRNLHNRVEVVFPIIDSRLQRRMLRILATSLRDNQGAWEKLPDNAYRRVEPGSPGDSLINSQVIFMNDSAGLEDLP